MRYRRLSYRYSVVLTTGQARPLGDPEAFEWPGVRLARAHWRPPADVYETDRAITVTVELAGIDPEELEVLLFEDAVTLEGQRRLPTEEDAGFYRTAHIRQGPFRLEVPVLASIDADHVEMHYDRGLLRLLLPKVGGERRGD
jgi:HSP20 family protein